MNDTLTDELTLIARGLAYIVVLAGYVVAAFTVIQIAHGTLPTMPEAALWVSAGVIVGTAFRFILDNLKGAPNA